MVFENSYGCSQNAQNGFGFDFLERYHKDADEFLSHIVRETGDETWILFMKPKQWVQTHSSENWKILIKVCQKAMANVFLERKRVLMLEFMQQGTTINSQV
jgi:hypothetical protein